MQLVRVVPFAGGVEQEAVERQVHVFVTDPAYVRVSAGQTVNLGNYESLRVDVSVTVPCYQEMVEETRESAAEWVATSLQNEIDQWTNA